MHEAVATECVFPNVMHVPSCNFLKNVIVSSFKINEEHYNKYFSSVSTNWISCDHTFKTAMNIGYYRDCGNKWNKPVSFTILHFELG